MKLLLAFLVGCGADPAPRGDTALAEPSTSSPTDTTPSTPVEPPSTTTTTTTTSTTGGCPLTARLGGGEQAWVELAEGDPVELVHGPQGGWHVVWSAEVGGTEPTLQLRGVITDEATGVVVSDVTYNVALAVVDECVGVSVGQYGYLDVSGLADGALDTPPELLAGHTLRLHLDATDFAGASASADLLVTAVPDPDDLD